jgi:hypothetical protein
MSGPFKRRGFNIGPVFLAELLARDLEVDGPQEKVQGEEHPDGHIVSFPEKPISQVGI